MSTADTSSQLFNHITAISHVGNISFWNWKMMNFKSNTAVLVNKIRDSTPREIIHFFTGTHIWCKSNETVLKKCSIPGRRQQAFAFNSSDQYTKDAWDFYTDDLISFSKIHHVELVNHYSFEILRASDRHSKTLQTNLCSTGSLIQNFSKRICIPRSHEGRIEH